MLLYSPEECTVARLLLHLSSQNVFFMKTYYYHLFGRQIPFRIIKDTIVSVPDGVCSSKGGIEDIPMLPCPWIIQDEETSVNVLHGSLNYEFFQISFFSKKQKYHVYVQTDHFQLQLDSIQIVNFPQNLLKIP